MRVAPAAPSAPGGHEGLPVGHIVYDQPGFRIAEHRSARDGNDEVRPAFSRKFAARAVHPGRRDELAAVFEIQQRVGAVVHGEHDVAAAAAVAAVRPALRHVFFPAEGDAAVPAVAGLDIELYLIEKHSVSSVYTATWNFMNPCESKSIPDAPWVCFFHSVPRLMLRAALPGTV